MTECYQSFNGQKGASNSAEKLRRLRLPNMLGKSFLDIGCNEGYFCAAALAAGASRVVGLDVNPHYIARARTRFPEIDFQQRSWDDYIEGQYDVILLASAIHYAEDQPLLLKKLTNTLTPAGVLIVELGIVDSPSEQYVEVERKPGEIKKYATRRALDFVLSDYAYRIIGESVSQSGDPVPRYVIHIRRRQPMILFFDVPSFSGKSTIVRQLARGRGVNDKFCLIALDRIFLDIGPEMARRFPNHQDVINRLIQLKANHRGFADRIMKGIGDEAYLSDFVHFLIDYKELRKMDMILWDGFVPEEHRNHLRRILFDRGFVIWSARNEFDDFRVHMNSNANWRQMKSNTSVFQHLSLIHAE